MKLISDNSISNLEFEVSISNLIIFISNSKPKFEVRAFNLVYFTTSTTFKKKASQSTKSKTSYLSNVLKCAFLIIMEIITLFGKNRSINKLNKNKMM